MVVLVAILGLLLVLACMGWGITNAITARNHFRDAQALDLEERVNARLEDRISKAVNPLLMRLRDRGDMPSDKMPPPILNDAEERARELRRQRINLQEQPGPEESDVTFPHLGEQPTGMEVESSV